MILITRINNNLQTTSINERAGSVEVQLVKIPKRSKCTKKSFTWQLCVITWIFVLSPLSSFVGNKKQVSHDNWVRNASAAYFAGAAGSEKYLSNLYREPGKHQKFYLIIFNVNCETFTFLSKNILVIFIGNLEKIKTLFWPSSRWDAFT